jgi:lipooligosaccharide transport system permease protein
MTAALRVLEAEAVHYRRAWRGSAVSTFLTPILYLLAMGMGLGAMVDRGAGPAELDVSYLEFLGPGLLAATAMQIGAGDAWGVMAGVKWRRTYHAILSTPVAVRDLVAGRLGFTAVRVTLMAAWFAVVLWLFGIAPLARGLAALPAAALTGLAFSAPVTAFTATLRSEQGLTHLFRFGIVPLFLFSGTFFPVSQLPDALEPLAAVTPLWHGVELVRATVLGTSPAWPAVVHVAVLTAFVLVGAALSVRQLRRRLLR